MSFVKGYISKLEVTYNRERDDFHPHFHILLSVSKNYFTDTRNYMSRDKLLDLWKSCKKDDSITQLDIRKVKNKNEGLLNSEIMELTKYIAKDSDYLYSVEVFSHFYNGLKGKRLFRFSGIYKKYRKMLTDGLLDDDIVEDIDFFYKLSYLWDVSGYRRTNFDKLSELERINLIKSKKNKIKEEIKNIDKD